MKHLLLTLLLATLCATGYGQTIKSLGYDTASGEVVANTGTNVLTFTNVVNFTDQSSGGVSISELTISGNVGGTFAFVAPLAFDDIESLDIVEQTRTNLGIPLPALTNDSNVTMMRALAGSTNTNEPFSGSVVVDTNTLVFTNGILLEVTTP
jgi:hypothetical protein